MGSNPLPVLRALISVWDKDGVVTLARELSGLGVQLVSTGSTAAAIRDAGVDVQDVSDLTGFPEMMGGRVKTLHPAVHAGILADKGDRGHLKELAAQGIQAFDLVVVNLYPFERTVISGAGPEETIEQIDIGGPTLLRAAAKNFGSVAVVVRPGRYDEVLAAIRGGGVPEELREDLAREAFVHVAAYDAAIAQWFSARGSEDELPAMWAFGLDQIAPLRYGENPHQRAGLYRRVRSAGPLGGAEVLQGKEMSYNNWLDAEAARALAGSFDQPAAVIVKHHNPCGAAVAEGYAEAYRAALASDPVSAFGGVVAFNGEVDDQAARAVAEVFTEVVVAPGFTDGARSVFGEKANLRLLRAPVPGPSGPEVRPIDGGALLQDADAVTETRDEMKVVGRREPTEAEWADLLFAWTVSARVKSNA
ncbi:MAG: bifunctional phosphoribosylaminoimidazolecarboxamide formyltransferase/IMP cyclohydrolase, partial [Actinomycetota bacterium]|nr:bifunctional phosphoribosylaminoimidazolecarboxamide formyltransferase/IMP cyclohydrolase [Actinomycetota bacterium]